MLTEQQQSFLKVLDLVEEAGCIDHVILIGSWAEFAYRGQSRCQSSHKLTERPKPQAYPLRNRLQKRF